MILLSACALQSGEDSVDSNQAALGFHGPRMLKQSHRLGALRGRPCPHPGQGGNGGEGGELSSVPITPDATGWIDAASNSLGVGGPWYWFADGYSSDGLRDGTCQTAGHADAECSLVSAPDPTLPGFANVGGKMCTSGVVARVLPSTSGRDDYANMGFAGIGFNPAQTLAGEQGVFDASAHHVIGFAFDIDQVPATGFHVQISTPSSATEGVWAYWGAAESFPLSPVAAGHNVVLFSDVRSPEATPVPVDTTQISGIQFVTPGTTSTSEPFAYCISNLKFLVSD